MDNDVERWERRSEERERRRIMEVKDILWTKIVHPGFYWHGVGAYVCSLGKYLWVKERDEGKSGKGNWRMGRGREEYYSMFPRSKAMKALAKIKLCPPLRSLACGMCQALFSCGFKVHMFKLWESLRISLDSMWNVSETTEMKSLPATRQAVLKRHMRERTLVNV